MARSYEETIATLYQAPFAGFVAERKRLAAELKAAGDKTGAVRLGKLNRPSIAAWAVNQLWWTAQRDFGALFATAQRIREGDLSASEAHRAALGTLRERALTLLAQAKQGASEATVRRIATTLSALAAAGSFAPDAPGQLTEDRDPPGFESAGSLRDALAGSLPSPRSPELEEARHERELEAARRREADEARERAVAERRRLEEQRARRRAEREKLERSLETLRSELETRARHVERMRGELAQAEGELEQSRSDAAQTEARLASLREEE